MSNFLFVAALAILPIDPAVGFAVVSTATPTAVPGADHARGASGRPIVRAVALTNATAFAVSR